VGTGDPGDEAALTIYSLSSRFSIRLLGRMADDAMRRQLMTLDELFDVVERIRPANGRSRRKMRDVLARRDPDVATRESPLEDFVAAPIRRFRLPPPKAQHEVTFNGQERRIDQCYVDAKIALEAKGFEWYSTRTEWDRDALRGNELQLAGFRVLTFTSAFTDVEIARQIAAALGIAEPDPRPARTFGEWTRTH
jgi:very-short-patch-repair endonuclease